METHLGATVIGGPKTVERKLREFLQLTQANELILHPDFYREGHTACTRMKWSPAGS
jgi:alkanesulfonate monooxygenase SsuD/methylene tetrahydromethanopterin reductase-like flavin-dependent oxidoreductase (luciferase family)